MQERRTASRFRTQVSVRWETLKSQGRGEVCDLSSSGCFVLAGGNLAATDLVRLDLILSNEVATAWGYVVYEVPEMGFAVRFAFADESGQRRLEQLVENVNRS
jgi:PilZ domain